MTELLVAFAIIILFVIYKTINNAVKEFFSIYKRKTVLERYPERYFILEKCKDIAFSKIWREDLIVIAESNFNIGSKDLDKPMKKYLDLLTELLGPELLSEFSYIHGSLESFIYNLTAEFIQLVVDKEVTLKSRIMNEDTPAEEIMKRYNDLTHKQ
jgi:hypothetical protein